MKKYLFTLSVLLAFGASNATAEDKKADKYEAQFENYDESNDPIEPVNRAIFKFNDVVDNIVYKPVARAYKGVVPDWGRKRVSNVVSNLSEPTTVVNSVLQGDADNAFTSLWRFVINSTFGVLGTFDAATEVGLKQRKEDFGQTLGVWGWKDSAYLVLPLIGPSNVRDTVGMGVDYFTDPFTMPKVVTEEGKWSVIIVRALDLRTSLLPTTDEIDRTSLDRYASYRSAYTQKRQNDVYNGKLPPVY